MSTALTQVANRLAVSEQELQSIVINTIMPNGGKQVSAEQFTSFMAVANEYKLNPLTKEVYAFPGKGGGIQPIVSIDGWLKIINCHSDFDGMEHEDILSDGKLTAIKCSIYRKSTSRPVSVTEYMSECTRNTDTWKKWPARMLRHKATIQAARYAFGLSGIVDPDEAERIQEVSQVEPNREEKTIEFYSDESFNANFPKWEQFIQTGRKTPTDIINMVQSKAPLTEKQKQLIESVEAE